MRGGACAPRSPKDGLVAPLEDEEFTCRPGKRPHGVLDEAPHLHHLQDPEGSMWLRPSHALEAGEEAVVPGLYTPSGCCKICRCCLLSLQGWRGHPRS